MPNACTGLDNEDKNNKTAISQATNEALFAKPKTMPLSLQKWLKVSACAIMAKLTNRKMVF